jgi:hypothetical protein
MITHSSAAIQVESDDALCNYQNNIVNEKDLTEGVSKLAAFFEQHKPSPVEPDNRQADEGAKKELNVGGGNLIPFPVPETTGKRTGKESTILAI